jgi:FkbM family methyltransferase
VQRKQPPIEECEPETRAGRQAPYRSRMRRPKLVRKLLAPVVVLSAVWRHPANRDRRYRAVSRALRFQARGRVLRRPTIVPYGSRSRFVAVLDGASSRLAAYANGPDWPEMQAWRRLLGPGQVFVDVGANVGLYTLWALDAGASVVVVEPIAENLAQLRRNLALNHYEAEIHHCAVAAEAGEQEMSGGGDLNTRALRIGKAIGDPRDRVVRVATVDEVLADRTAAGMKVDVEGAERLVLEGSRRALSERRIAVLQLEWNRQSVRQLGEDRLPVAEMLLAHGYALMRPDETGMLHPASEPFDFGPDMFALL